MASTTENRERRGIPDDPWWDPTADPKRWWPALARFAAVVLIAVLVHGATNSFTLAVVILFAGIGVFEGFASPHDDAKRGRLPLPIPQHPWVALACAVIAAGAWAITHFALHGHGQVMAPAITYLALCYIWVLRSPSG